MRQFTKLFCTVIVLALTGLLHSQDLIYTISGDFEGGKIALDSILFENLSNGTEILFSDLPEQSEYKINLTTRELINPTGMNMFLMGDNFQLIRNTPGQLTINCWNKQIGNTHLNVYNIQGQKLHSTSFTNVTLGSSINIQLPVAGIYLVELKSQRGSVTYKGIGSNYYGGFSVTVDDKTPAHTSDLKSSLIEFVSDFNFGVGDSLRISAYREDYYARPIIREITSSTSVDFTFKVSSVVTKGISDAYVSFDVETQSSLSYDNRTGIVTMPYISDTISIDVGDIITIDADTIGYIRKVVNVSEVDGEVILETQQAYMNDVFVDTEFKLSTALLEPNATLKSSSTLLEISESLTDAQGYIHPVAVYYRDERGIMLRKSTLEETDVIPGRWEIVNYYNDFTGRDIVGDEHEDVHLYVTEGHISLLADAVFEFDFDHEEELTKDTKIKKGDLNSFKFYLDGSSEFLTRLALDMNYEDSDSDIIELLDIPESYAFFVVAGVPVWLTIDPYIYAAYDYAVNAYLEADWGFYKSNTLKLGGLYDRKSDELSPIYHFEDYDTVYPLYVDGELNAFARFEIYPRVEARFYDFFGPFAEIIPYVEGYYNAALHSQIGGENAETFLAWKSGIDVGLDFRVGAVLSFLGIGKRTIALEPINFFEAPLWRSPENLELLTELPNSASVGSTINMTFRVTDLIDQPANLCPVYISGDGDFGEGLFLTDTNGEIEVDWTISINAGENSFIANIYGPDLSVIDFVEGSVNISAVIPSVTTSEINDITENSAKSGGSIYSSGGSTIIEKGVCWSTAQNPTLSNDRTVDGTGEGAFTSSITGLSPNTTYYVRAYASNSAGTGYGNQRSFRTSTPPILATVTTSSISNIKSTTATCGGNVTSDGGSAVIVKGVCWSTSQNPTSYNQVTTDGGSVGSFISYLTDLNPSTTYYVRAYAMNGVGTAYGEQRSFTTSAPVIVPTVTTNNVINIGTTSANSGGTIVSTGGADILVKGVCWSTSQYPTTDNPEMLTTNGSGSESYSSYISGLAPNTTYYVRAYAINSAGTGYGNQRSFKTDPDGGTVTDYDGNVYNTVQIGDQVWMADNLRTTHYSDGSPIPLVENNSSWASLTASDKAYCWYDNDISYKSVYGALYTWSASMNGASSSNSNPSGVQGVCPSGWHLPSDDEWIELTEYLGGSSIAGGKLKETGTAHWNSPNTGATNESGFTAVAGGSRHYDGSFENFGIDAPFWTATQWTGGYAMNHVVGYNHAGVNRGYGNKIRGREIRCVKD